MRGLLTTLLLICISSCTLPSKPVVNSNLKMPIETPVTDNVGYYLNLNAHAVSNNTIVVSGVVRSLPLGWTFQVLVDTDRNTSTGYSVYGFDYVVRGPGVDPQGLVIRRATNQGWQEVVGTFSYFRYRDRLHITIPIDSLMYGNAYGSRLIVWFIKDGVDLPDSGILDTKDNGVVYYGSTTTQSE